MEKYGFVYVWFDRKRAMFYVGCHWGTEDDGYVCSSNRMRKAYRRRPHDFKRRVVARLVDRDMLFSEEHRWLSMIKDSELGWRYYNLRKWHAVHWAANPSSRQSVAEKLSTALKGKPTGRPMLPQTRAALVAANLGNKYGQGVKHSPEVVEARASKLRGKKRPPEVRQKISASKTGKTKYQPPCSDVTKAKISAANRGRKRSPESIEKQRTALLGRKHTEETKRKMSEAHRQRSLDGAVPV